MIAQSIINPANICINCDDNLDNSAALDIRSTSKGVLIPRMTEIQRDAIQNPTKGLLVFVTDLSSFWFFNGTTWETLRGLRGPQGIQGEQGITGLQGLQGPRGLIGPQGIQGTKGDQGPAGIHGADGLPGPQGPQGVRGAQGLAGKDGEKGDTGPMGSVGATGPQGPRGIQGEKGDQGPAGINCDCFSSGELEKIANARLAVFLENYTIQQAKKQAQQEQKIKELEAELKQLTTILKDFRPSKNRKSKQQYFLELKEATLLSQNEPNPFYDATTIHYFIPETTQEAAIQITTREGNRLQFLPIEERGSGQVIIKTSTYPAGSYYYSLILDGQVMESKQMILTK